MRDQIAVLPALLGAPYSTGLEVFAAVIGPLAAAEDLPWPRDAGSPSGLADLACSFLADMACHLPPVEVMEDRIRSGRNRLEDFLPGRRFIDAVLAVRLQGLPGLARRGDADDLYRLIFDLVAAACGWPSWQETSHAGWGNWTV